MLAHLIVLTPKIIRFLTIVTIWLSDSGGAC